MFAQHHIVFFYDNSRFKNRKIISIKVNYFLTQSQYKNSKWNYLSREVENHIMFFRIFSILLNFGILQTINNVEYKKPTRQCNERYRVAFSEEESQLLEEQKDTINNPQENHIIECEAIKEADCFANLWLIKKKCQCYWLYYQSHYQKYSKESCVDIYKKAYSEFWSNRWGGCENIYEDLKKYIEMYLTYIGHLKQYFGYLEHFEKYIHNAEHIDDIKHFKDFLDHKDFNDFKKYLMMHENLEHRRRQVEKRRKDQMCQDGFIRDCGEGISHSEEDLNQFERHLEHLRYIEHFKDDLKLYTGIEDLNSFGVSQKDLLLLKRSKKPDNRGISKSDFQEWIKRLLEKQREMWDEVYPKGLAGASLRDLYEFFNSLRIRSAMEQDIFDMRGFLKNILFQKRNIEALEKECFDRNSFCETLLDRVPEAIEKSEKIKKRVMDYLRMFRERWSGLETIDRLIRSGCYERIWWINGKEIWIDLNKGIWLDIDESMWLNMKQEIVEYKKCLTKTEKDIEELINRLEELIGRRTPDYVKPKKISKSRHSNPGNFSQACRIMSGLFRNVSTSSSSHSNALNKPLSNSKSSIVSNYRPFSTREDSHNNTTFTIGTPNKSVLNKQKLHDVESIDGYSESRFEPHQPWGRESRTRAALSSNHEYMSSSLLHSIIPPSPSATFQQRDPTCNRAFSYIGFDARQGCLPTSNPFSQDNLPRKEAFDPSLPNNQSGDIFGRPYLMGNDLVDSYQRRLPVSHSRGRRTFSPRHNPFNTMQDLSESDSSDS